MNAVNPGLAFLEGLSLLFSPCILPVLPIVLSASLGEKGRPFGIILGFVLAFTAFTLFSRQLVLAFGINPTVIRQLSFILLLLLGVVMLSATLSERFALWTQRIADWGNALNSRQHAKPGKQGFFSGLLWGCCIGLIWVPCSGPVLAAVIIESLQQQTSFQSVLVVLAFSLGAGVPMLFIAWGGNSVMRHFNFFKRHGVLFRKATGAVIILTVLWTAQDSLFPLNSLSSSGRNTPADIKTGLKDGLKTPYPAPPLLGIQGWINSKPLALPQLKGHVVLVDFWTYSCINCIRTLPHLKAWDDRYRKQGLVILGIHSPEFEFERDAENVRQAVLRQGIRYPVALDSGLKTWQSFRNSYWPAEYLIDKNGKIVYTHFGEGDEDVMENNIRYLLGLKGPTVAHPDQSAAFNGLQSPETYLGYARAENFAGPEPARPNQPVHYSFPAYLPINQWALNGVWRIDAQQITAEQPKAALRFNFYARYVYLVLGAPKNRSLPVHVLLNGTPVQQNAGESVRQGQLHVDHHTLYTLIDMKHVQNGLLELQVSQPGLEAYAFTFGS